MLVSLGSLIVPGEALLQTDAQALERWGIPGGPAIKLASEVMKWKGATAGTYYT